MRALTETCGYSIGTVWTGPKFCGRPAKYLMSADPARGWPTEDMNICGIHKRSAERWGNKVTPLEVKP